MAEAGIATTTVSLTAAEAERVTSVVSTRPAVVGAKVGTAIRASVWPTTSVSADDWLVPTHRV